MKLNATEKPDSAAEFLWSRLDEVQQAVLRVIGQDTHDVFVTMRAIEVETKLPLAQIKLAQRRLSNHRLIELGVVHPQCVTGYMITAKGRRILAQDNMNLVLGQPADDRPAIAGHTLPWSIVPYVKPPARRPEPDEDDDCEESPLAYIVDADGYRVLDQFPVDGAAGKLWTAVVEHLAKPGETMADLALAEKAAKVAKLRLENDRQEAADLRSLVEKLLPKGYSIVWKEPRS